MPKNNYFLFLELMSSGVQRICKKKENNKRLYEIVDPDSKKGNVLIIIHCT